MINRIAVTRGGDLHQQEWVFWYFTDRHALVLDYYYEQARPTRRHKFQTVPETYYTRAHRREASLAEADVPLPPDVIEEARQKFNETLRVVKWSERDKK